MAILTGEGTTFTIASDAEAFSGADVSKAVTPDQLLAVVSQSVAAVSGGLIYKGVFNATTLKPDLSNARQGDFYKVSVADTAYGETYAVGDMLLINADMGGTIDANKIDKIDNSEALTSLDDLTDVTLVNSNTGEVLRYNGTDWVNQEISADDLKADHTGVNYTGASTDSIETHLAGIDTALATGGGASDLNGLSDVTITGAATGEVLRYSGAQWVDAQLSYNDLSNTPTLPSSSDDLTSDHTGVNYTGANTATVTTHLSGIDSELNNRADTVNSVAVSNGAVTIDGDDIIAPRTGTNYTAANTDTVTVHLSGIDSELNNRADTVNSVAVSNGAVTIDGDDIIAPRTGTNYTGANTDSITTHLAGIDTALASAGGASNLNGLSDVTITGAGAGEVLRYSGAQWVDAQLSYNDLSNTPTLPSSSDDLTSDHTGVNYTGANTDSITTHLAGIDTALASAGGGGATLTVLSNTTYTLSANDAAGIHIWYGVGNSSTFTVTMPDISNVISTAASVNGVPVETFEVYVGRAQAGDITISAADGIDLLGDGSLSYSTTQTVNAGQWVKLIGWYVSGTTQRYIMDSAAQPRDAALDSISGLTTAADQLLYTTASDTYATTSLTAAGRALLDDADAAAQRTTLGALGEVSDDPSPQLAGDLDLNGRDIVTTSNADLDLAPHGTGAVVLRGNTNPAALKFNCENNSHFVEIKSPAHGSYTGASYTLTLPPDAGGADQVLKTNGSGGLDWVDQTSAGASNLNGLSDVTITGAATGEVLRYSGAQWVDAQLSYNDLSNTPTLPSSSDDLTSDHTGVNYTGANTDTVTTHLSGIDSELNNRADTVNSVAVANGAVTIDGDDIIAPRTGTNYTAANTDTITTHLAGIDTALASAGGASNLNGLSDVTITGAATGEILRYNGANWVDAPLSISDDPSPSLGGDLDLNGNGISSHLVPSTTGKDIGTASAEWRNLYLADNSKILFGLDQDVELIHDPDDGLILDLGVTDGSNDPQFELKSQTSGNLGARLTFTTESTTPAADDRVGQMRFQGKDSAGNLQDYGFIYGQIHDPTSGAEAGKISILAYPASANTRGLHVEGIAGDASGAKVNIDHNGSSYGLHLNNTLVTSTANELNLLDGGTSVGSSITIVDTDGVIVNDGGTSKLVPASDLKTYVGGGASAPTVTPHSISSNKTITTHSGIEEIHLIDNGTSNVVFTIPAAGTAGAGYKYQIKRLGSGTCSVSPTNGTIDGASSFSLASQFDSVTLVSNGSNYFII